MGRESGARGGDYPRQSRHWRCWHHWGANGGPEMGIQHGSQQTVNDEHLQGKPVVVQVVQQYESDSKGASTSTPRRTCPIPTPVLGTAGPG